MAPDADAGKSLGQRSDPFAPLTSQLLPVDRTSVTITPIFPPVDLPPRSTVHLEEVRKYASSSIEDLAEGV
jgi:hypothetical protein